MTPRTLFRQGPPSGPDLHTYLGIRFVNTLATQIQLVAVGWQIYELTKNPYALGLVGALEFFPMLLVVLPAGDLADRVDRRFVLLATHAVEAIAVAALCYLSFIGSREVWMYFCVITLFGVARGLYMPAQQSLLPFLVPAENLSSAIAKSSSIFTMATIAGPAAGGILLASIGTAPTYAVCFALFILCAVATLILRMRSMVRGKLEGTAVSRIIEGFAFIKKRPIIFGAISLDLFAVLFGGVIALLPIYASDILHVGEEGLGWLRTAPSVGAALVAFALARWPMQRHTGRHMFISVAVFGVATIVFGISENFLLSLFALAMTGAADMVSVYIRSTFVQLSTPDHMRGRISAVNALFISGSNELGGFRAGMFAGAFGTVAGVVLGGIGTLAVVGLWMRGFPQLLKIDNFGQLSAK